MNVGIFRSRTPSRLLIVLMTVGTIFSTSVATAHTSCTIVSGTTTVHYGDEHQNSCTGGSGQGSMFGYGDVDTLGGGLGHDDIRGATGNDTLSDGQGSGDDDRFCDGSGTDTIKMQDGDSDDVWWNYPDGFSADYSEYNGLMERNPDDAVVQLDYCPF